MATIKDLLNTQIYKCREDISHTCDGPVTPLVAISRAILLASDKVYSQEIIAESLEEILLENGWLIEDPEPIKGQYES